MIHCGRVPKHDSLWSRAKASRAILFVIGLRQLQLEKRVFGALPSSAVIVSQHVEQLRSCERRHRWRAKARALHTLRKERIALKARTTPEKHHQRKVCQEAGAIS